MHEGVLQAVGEVLQGTWFLDNRTGDFVEIQSGAQHELAHLFMT